MTLHHLYLLSLVVVAVAGLIFLVTRYRWNSALALVVASLFVGVMSGTGIIGSVKAVSSGVWDVLAVVGVVIILGTMMGRMLADSGGAEVVANTFSRALGGRWLPWAMLLIAFIVGLPVFFGVGLVLLAPILFTLVKETRMPLLALGIPVLAGLSTVHGLVPPHPGPMMAIQWFGASVGRTVWYSLLVALPTAILAGPILGKYLTTRVPVELSGELASRLTPKTVPRGPAPSFGLALLTISLPVVLMPVLPLLLEPGIPPPAGQARFADTCIRFVKEPTRLAMLAGVALSLYTFRASGVLERGGLAKLGRGSLGPSLAIVLVVAAGGGFKQVLVDSGVGDAMANLLKGSRLSPLFLGWLLAGLIRVATGSATVAISTAAGLMAGVAAGLPHGKLELLVVAMGAGSLILSHVNDGGFWFVKEYFGMSVAQTLKTWTVMESAISIIALVFVLLLAMVV